MYSWDVLMPCIHMWVNSFVVSGTIGLIQLWILCVQIVDKLLAGSCDPFALSACGYYWGGCLAAVHAKSLFKASLLKALHI
jgi:hypothetical protein